MAHRASARRELPLGPTSRSRCTRGGYFLSPHHKSRNTSSIPTIWGRKQRSPGSIPPRAVWKPQPHWLIADWLGLMEPAPGESFPSGQRRSPAAPGQDRVSSPDHKSFHISTTPTTWRRKRRSPGSIPPSTTPNPSGWLLIGCGSLSRYAARIAPRANVEEVPPHPGRIRFHTQIRYPSIPLQLQ